MSTIHKFIFDRSFDDGRSPPRHDAMAEQEEIDAAAEAEAPPPEPTFTKTELDALLAAARAEAYGQGFAEGQEKGRADAETEAQTALTGALERVEADLGRLIAAEEAARAARQENTMRLVLAIVRKLMPAYVAQHGAAEVEAAVTAFLTELVDEVKLVIRVHEKWLDSLRDRIEDMAARHGFAGQVSVLADPRLGELDVKADWGDGGAERDPQALWAEVERIAGDLLAGFPDAPAPAGKTASAERMAAARAASAAH